MLFQSLLCPKVAPSLGVWLTAIQLGGCGCRQFVVDGEWVYAPEQPTTTDINGNVCNVLQVEAIESSEVEQLEVESPRTSYSRLVPEGAEYAKEPPGLPAQLSVNLLEPRPPVKPPEKALASRGGGSASDTDTGAGRPVFLEQPHLPPGALPDPTHVVINHLFCNLKHPGMLVYASTHRHDAGKSTATSTSPLASISNLDLPSPAAVCTHEREPEGICMSCVEFAGAGVDKFVTNVLYCPDTRPVGYRPLGSGDGYDGLGARHDSEPNEC